MNTRRYILAAMLSVSLSLSAQTARVRTTYYNLKGKTAMGIKTRGGICAVSPDLERKGFKLGEYILLTYKDGRKVRLLIADRTAKRIKNTVDIWSANPIPNGKDVKVTLIYDND